MKKVDRDDYIDAVLDLAGKGRADVSIRELCTILSVTKGSFYSHFPGGLGDLHAAVASAWLRARTEALPDSTVDAVQEPLDRLRVLRAAAVEHAARDDAMRRWAVSGAGAAEAVAEVDQAVTGHLVRALSDLGFAGDEPIALAALLATALAASGRPGPAAVGPGTYETVLAVLARAAATAPEYPLGESDVQVAPGATPDELVLYLTAKELGRPERRQLLEIARGFASNQDPARPAGRAEDSSASEGTSA